MWFRTLRRAGSARRVGPSQTYGLYRLPVGGRESLDERLVVLAVTDLGGMGRLGHAVLFGPEVPDNLPFQEPKDRPLTADR